MSDMLFMMRIAVNPGGMVTVCAWEAPHTVQHGTHIRVDISVVESCIFPNSTKRKRRTVYKRGQLWVGIPMHQSIHGVYARRCVLDAVGTTCYDSECSHTPIQEAFAAMYADYLSVVSLERYGEG